MNEKIYSIKELRFISPCNLSMPSESLSKQIMQISLPFYDILLHLITVDFMLWFGGQICLTHNGQFKLFG